MRSFVRIYHIFHIITRTILLSSRSATRHRPASRIHQALPFAHTVAAWAFLAKHRLTREGYHRATRWYFAHHGQHHKRGIAYGHLPSWRLSLLRNACHILRYLNIADSAHARCALHCAACGSISDIAFWLEQNAEGRGAGNIKLTAHERRKSGRAFCLARGGALLGSFGVYERNGSPRGTFHLDHLQLVKTTYPLLRTVAWQAAGGFWLRSIPARRHRCCASPTTAKRRSRGQFTNRARARISGSH